MKKITPLINLFLLVFFSLSAQNVHELFFDDFEENISNDATFTKWTTENLEGWHYWHIVPGQHMRFENNDLTNDDWLVTLPIKSDDKDSIRITFDYLYHASKEKPKLLITKSYNGDSSQSTWTELDYSLGENENQWYNSGDITIVNDYDTIYLAFHYKAEPANAIYFLLDNFKVQSYNPVVYEKAGESEHFEFYTNMVDSLNYHLEITLPLEKQFDKLSSLWNRPGIENIFEENKKIKIYYTEKENNIYFNSENPEWKNGSYNSDKLEIYISPLISPTQKEFYTNLKNLALNEFSQLAVEKKFKRENSNYFPPYFLEGFGLYEMGIRPKRDSIVKYLSDNPTPDFNFIKDTTGITNTLKKDLIICNIEGQLLTTWSYLAVNPGASSYIQSQWPNYLQYFYQSPENNRIKLQKSSTNFDFYVAQSDTNHLAEIIQYFENAYSTYSIGYDYFPQHRFNVVLCPTEEIGKALTGYNRFNGGAGCGGDLVIDLSPNYNYNAKNYYSKYFGYAGMCAHEFFHIFYNHFMWNIPGGFWAEGTADFNQRHSLGWELPVHSFWKIKELFTTYATKYNVEINLEHISTNPNQELDVYFFGDAFFEYIYLYRGGYPKIMEFFNKQMDFSVFNATYEEIDKGYINYLKSLVGITSVKEIENSNFRLWFSNNDLLIQNTYQVGKIDIEIFTITGQKVFQKDLMVIPSEISTISIPQLSENKLYIVKLKSEHEVFVQKLYNQ